MGDTESCSSRAVDLSSLSAENRKHKQKVNIYNEVLRRLMALNVADSRIPGFEDDLWAHFHRLPTRYLRTLASASTHIPVHIYTCVYILCICVYIYCQEVRYVYETDRTANKFLKFV